MKPAPRLAVDTGGTFTDFVRLRAGRIEVWKLPSTPDRPDRAILAGAARGDAAAAGEIIHGSTVATNALLERKGARTALVTTRGFEDVLEIGRQARRDLYGIFTTRPTPLAPRARRLGLRERILFDGRVETPLDPADLAAAVARLRRDRTEAVAVCFLFSFQNPAHEQQAAAALAELGVPVSLSSEILPEHREYERTSTTVINAYLAPVMIRYLERLEAGLGGRRLRVMQSNGGTVKPAAARAAPVRTLLSGPAGGVVGAHFLARRAGHAQIITFDMGGTSTDVALLDGGVPATHESEVDGLPVGVPMLDIHTVGAGGGSIAALDAGGALRVGPESAGADPGPICYGRGVGFTVTDANVLLGRLPPRFFLGGGMTLHPERIRTELGRQAWTRRWTDLESLAEGVIAVVNTHMQQAIRLISVERGHDVRDFTLVCFGGAGALHAATLAAELGIRRVLVPPHPGALSALGLLLADARKDYARTVLGLPRPTPAKLRRVLAALHRQGFRELAEEGFARNDVRVEDFVDARYVGQSYELTIPFTDDWAAAFHRAHDRRYGHADPAQPVEVVSVRTTLTGPTPKPALPRARRGRGAAVALDRAPVWYEGRWRRAALYERAALASGHVLRGPAVIGEYSATTFVPPGFQCEGDAFGNLVLTP